MRPVAMPLMESSPAAIAWEEPACLLCGVQSFLPLLEASDPRTGVRFLIVQCKRCGLCLTNPRPDEVSVQPFYPDDYHCHQRKTAKPSRKRDAFAQLLPPVGEARLLDFGCGAGTFLARMQALGWNAVGLDVSDAAVDRLRESGLNAQVGTLPMPHWRDESFEAITMIQSLEHTHHPLEVLREAHRLLTDDGTLVVAVPNFDGWGARYFGADWYGLDLPRHLTHFTQDSLHLMLYRAGFAYVELQAEVHHSWIRHSAERRRGALASVLRTRLGSRMIGWWGKSCGLAEGILAVAKKSRG